MAAARNYIIVAVVCALTWYMVRPFYQNFLNFRTQIAKYQLRTKDVYEPNSGKGVFPAVTQTALYIIDSLKLKDYTLFGRLGDPNSKDPVNLHRINEGAWPIRQDSLSRNVLGFADEMDTAKKFTRVCQVNNITFGTY